MVTLDDFPDPRSYGWRIFLVNLIFFSILHLFRCSIWSSAARRCALLARRRPTRTRPDHTPSSRLSSESEVYLQAILRLRNLQATFRDFRQTIYLSAILRKLVSLIIDLLHSSFVLVLPYLRHWDRLVDSPDHTPFSRFELTFCPSSILIFKQLITFLIN